MSEQVAKFEGWAIVEMFGHGREIGYVTTQYFGSACLFQIDVPELPARERTLRRPEFVNDEWTPAGAKVKGEAVSARTRMIGPSSIFALNPCSEEAARMALDEFVPRKYVVLEIPKDAPKQLPSRPRLGVDYCAECGREIDDCTCDCTCDDDDQIPTNDEEANGTEVSSPASGEPSQVAEEEKA